MVDQFPIVLRGYDKDRVDEAFAAAQETVNRLREQVQADDQTILQLQAQLQEEKNRKANPNSFASLGANAQQMLSSAEQTSAELLERAKKDAAAARATVQLQAMDCRNDVENFVKSTETAEYKGVTTEDANGNILTDQTVNFERKIGLADHFPVVVDFKYTIIKK